MHESSTDSTSGSTGNTSTGTSTASGATGATGSTAAPTGGPGRRWRTAGRVGVTTAALAAVVAGTVTLTGPDPAPAAGGVPDVRTSSGFSPDGGAVTPDALQQQLSGGAAARAAAAAQAAAAREVAEQRATRDRQRRVREAADRKADAAAKARRAEARRAEAERARQAKARAERARKARAQAARAEAARDERARAARAAARRSAAAKAGTSTGSTGNPRSTARAMVSARGWGSGQFSCLDSLWQKESNWNHKARNPSSGAYGIPQSLPGSKMASAGADWRTNPATQIRWGLDYIADRYGTPCAAWAHSKARNWY